ncbi:hypothetical protein [Chitinimonas koreensis]|uniref:hypothetical protein n=1 Tax=Chitinimonas koreensis TaxID=356302 RepID=UPI00040DC9B5|nr:hypothetical protein [Chitinimonas koreensis]QNM98647.1 hypothetical protein H9L41_10745 [Chitinimonas koreensis]
MATPTTLIGFWTDEVGRLDAALTAARGRLASTQAAEQVAIAAYAGSAAQLQAARDQVEAIRKQLAAIPLPADGDPLLIAMRDALIAWRQAGANHAANEAAKRRLGEQRAADAARVNETAARLADARAALAAAQPAHDQRQAWAAAPLASYKSQAQAALTDFEAAARGKVEADFPSNADDKRSFIKRVRARRALADTLRANAAARAAAALAGNTAWNESSTRQIDKLAALQATFDAAVAALQAYAQTQPAVAQARDALKSLAELPGSALTAAQKAVLISADATLTDAREDALEKLKTRDDKQAALDAADLAYQNALFAARAAEPDKTDAALRAADPTLQTKFDAVGTLAGELGAAESALAADLPLLSAWWVAVPDALWDRLDRLDAAVATLGPIKDATVADIKSAVVNAETALAAALDAASRERRKVVVLHEALAQRQAEATAAAELLARRRQSAVRFLAEV